MSEHYSYSPEDLALQDMCQTCQGAKSGPSLHCFNVRLAFCNLYRDRASFRRRRTTLGTFFAIGCRICQRDYSCDEERQAFVQRATSISSAVASTNKIKYREAVATLHESGQEHLCNLNRYLATAEEACRNGVLAAEAAEKSGRKPRRLVPNDNGALQFAELQLRESNRSAFHFESGFRSPSE